MAESTLAPLLTIEQVAEYLGIPVASLYAQRSQGRPTPPAVKIGKYLRYRQSDVEAWVESQTER